MSKVIIDSSSIYNFVRLIRQFDIRRICTYSHVKVSDALDLIENIIEAYLLYDEIYLDKDSIQSESHYYDGLPLLKLPYNSLVCGDQDTLLEYADILRCIKIKEEQIKDIAHHVEYDWESFEDAHGNIGFSILKPQDFYYNLICNQFIEKYSSALKSSAIDIDRTVFYNIIRYLYYIRLSHKYNANLILHPNRGIFALAFSQYKKLFDSHNIIQNFEPCIDSLQYRFNNWMTIRHNIIRIPLVANYVISKLKHSSPEAIFDCINEIRESDEAKAFRSGLNEFIAIYNSNKSDFSRIIDELNTAVELWSRRIDIMPNQKERIITLSEANINVSINLGLVSIGTNAPQRNIIITEDGNHPTTSKLLCFIHNTLKVAQI